MSPPGHGPPVALAGMIPYHPRVTDTGEKSPRTACRCSPLTVSVWEDTTVVFNEKPFLTRRIPLFLRLPIGLRDEITALERKAAALKLDLAIPHMILQRDRGVFRGELLLGLGQETGLPETTHLAGSYRTAVHRGSHTQLGRAARGFLRRLRRELGIKPCEVFFWYANCPACWSEAGGPLTIILGRIGSAVPETREQRDRSP